MSLWSRLLRRLEAPPEKDPWIEQRIQPPRYASKLTGEKFTGYRPDIQAKAQARAAAADAHRSKAALIEAGGPSVEGLWVRKRA